MAEWTFDFSGGHLALDFANTVSSRVDGKGPIERLPTWRELVRFARQAEIVSGKDADRLFRWGEAHPAPAEKLRRAALELRDSLYDVSLAVANERKPDPADLAVLTAWSRRLRLDERLEWVWADGDDAPDAFLAPVVKKAIEILTSEWKARLRECGSDTCAWVFLDTSKNRSRRWCDMKTCGNREKARRFHERHS